MKQRNKIILQLKNYLSKMDNVEFALIYGSFAGDNFNDLSDLDIGVYVKKQFDLLELGKIVSDLEKLTEKSIDLIELNELYEKNPLLTYNIISNCILLVQKDEDIFVNYKRRTLLSYLDTQTLRKSINQAFYNRISEKKFGKFNYA